MIAIGYFTKGFISRFKREEFDQDAYLDILEKTRNLNQQ